jgi:hypothetical protein
MVEARARELARINGRGSKPTEADYQQAKRELTGESEIDAQKENLESWHNKKSLTRQGILKRIIPVASFARFQILKAAHLAPLVAAQVTRFHCEVQHTCWAR